MDKTVTLQVHTTAPRSVPVNTPQVRAITRWGLFPVDQSNDLTVVADPCGIAWGEGHTVAEAVNDWEIAAREIAALLKDRDIVPELETRNAILRRWFG